MTASFTPPRNRTVQHKRRNCYMKARFCAQYAFDHCVSRKGVTQAREIKSCVRNKFRRQCLSLAWRERTSRIPRVAPTAKRTGLRPCERVRTWLHPIPKPSSNKASHEANRCSAKRKVGQLHQLGGVEGAGSIRKESFRSPEQKISHESCALCRPL